MAATCVDSTTQVDLASTACTIAVPTHSEGDLLIALCLANAASPPGEWTRPVGWTETGGNQTGDSLLQMCTKIASGSEPVDYEWTHNNSGDLCIIMLSYSGAALTSPSDHFSDQGSVYTCPTAESDNDDPPRPLSARRLSNRRCGRQSESKRKRLPDRPAQKHLRRAALEPTVYVSHT